MSYCAQWLRSAEHVTLDGCMHDMWSFSRSLFLAAASETSINFIYSAPVVKSHPNSDHRGSVWPHTHNELWIRGSNLLVSDNLTQDQSRWFTPTKFDETILELMAEMIAHAETGRDIVTLLNHHLSCSK